MPVAIDFVSMSTRLFLSGTFFASRFTYFLLVFPAKFLVAYVVYVVKYFLLA